MALKTEKTEVPVSTAPVTAAPPPRATAPSSETTVLELALYKIYTWGAMTYEAGKPYRFRNADAMILLAEQDLGRPIWKLWRKPVPKAAPKNEPVDVTMVHAPIPVNELGEVSTAPVGAPADKRIDVGDDSEIADILQKDRPDSSEDVTV